LFSRQIGIDLGTANVIVYVRGKGIVLTEPSVVAISHDDNGNRPRIVAVGEEARLMLGRTPGTITAIRPMRDGVIADYVITEKMLEYFISLGGIVVSKSVRAAGNRLDEAIANFVRKRYNLMIGERTAEDVKIQIGSALPMDPELTMEVRGRDLIAGLPRTITIGSNEITEAMEPVLQQIVSSVKNVLEETPPELASDIIDKGMVLSGGGALLRNMDKLLTQVTGVACYAADNPLYCVAKGTGLALEHFDFFKKSLVPVH